MNLKTYVETEHGGTIKVAAEAIGVSPSFLSELLADKRKPSYDTIVKIRDATGGKIQPADWFDLPKPTNQGKTP